ncbi:MULTISPECIES: MFS transporter [Streptomyces]|uniref:MFS transporter n=1 Tax=Streptomyces TaxID=1883 RepID=UPI00064D32E5|nr:MULTISPECIES: MFS transporter [Streptomyces]AKL64740.1 MFS transporter [Streptomyces sp. Mg1]RPK41302.1 multidrug efflux system protein MdtL [Streptomyces sp. ADI91-18]WBY18628.1 MFS transporter [Streptomyces goshikiensis]WSR97323.1 MFS transporter [Streptomyces goshikiensis]
MTGAREAAAPAATGVGGGWVSALSLANLGVWVGWFGPLQLLLARQAEYLAPEHKTSTLALVTGVGAAVSMVANPVFGALSDRTTARVGRRVPWVVAGVAGGAAGLLLLSRAASVTAVIAGWCLVQLALNAAFAALTAAVPDQVPRRQRGLVGGWLGVSQVGGILVGTALATAAGGITAGYLACAAFSVLAAVPYVLMRRDVRLSPADRPALRWRTFLTGFWIDPRRHPDFGWAWLTRFLMNLSYSISTMYLLYYLTDAVRYEGDADTGVLILTALNALTLLSTVVVSGIRSDRSGRRKAYVIGSGLVITAATLLLAVWQTWTGAVVASLVLGLGFGVYTSVDFALLTDVLPTAEDRGRDLGVINIANALPQVLAPVIAAPVVSHLGGYTPLYALAGFLALAGSVLVRRIRGVA